MRSLMVILLAIPLATLAPAQQPLITEHGIYAVHLPPRTIGTEEYSIADAGSHRQLTITANTSDRGMKRTVDTTLDYLPNLTPTHFEQHSITHSHSHRASGRQHLTHRAHCQQSHRPRTRHLPHLHQTRDSLHWLCQPSAPSATSSVSSPTVVYTTVNPSPAR